MVYDDNTLMGKGKYKGYKLGQIPAEYLLWIFENTTCFDDKNLYEYILERKDELEQEFLDNNKNI